MRFIKETFQDILNVFFPRSFGEKYKYLGYMPYVEDGDVFEALLPLILTMDYYAKRWWTPRWFLRLLHLFGNDNSVVRVRNWPLHNLSRWLTSGILLVDYKLKWTDYDLRISVFAPEPIQLLSDSIETSFYKRGRRKFLMDVLKDADELKDAYYIPLSDLEKLYETYLKSNYP
jgi:hypothetical protein